MIKRLKIKFIALSLGSLLAMLLIIILAMNIINYSAVVDEADTILDIITQNRGRFPDGALPHPNMSPEIPHESRYFSVQMTGACEIIGIDTSRILSVDDEHAKDYALLAYKSGMTSGFIDNFRFAISNEGDTVRISFLDWGRKLDSFRIFLLTSSAVALVAFILISVLLCLLAGKIIRPIAESYEKQKRFITDAGHEIKTPLTIINANVDVLTMELGKNECLDDIEKQTKRLTSLTNELVYLARMEEASDTVKKIDFPVSEIIYDTAAPFATLALSQNKKVELNIEPMLSMRGDGKAVSQLVSILMDNALKYSPDNGTIKLNFSRQGRVLALSIENEAVYPIDPAQLDRIFDRFYRTDSSRNSETGGHGIGLSIAKAIVAAHSGRITAGAGENNTFTVTVNLPI